jgi:hypothetical protein
VERSVVVVCALCAGAGRDSGNSEEEDVVVAVDVEEKDGLRWVYGEVDGRKSVSLAGVREEVEDSAGEVGAPRANVDVGGMGRSVCFAVGCAGDSLSRREEKADDSSEGVLLGEGFREAGGVKKA